MMVSACNSEEIDAFKANMDDKQVWVFIQFNVPEENDAIESYYYYGQISGSIYRSISNNKLSRGFILLENVKYWGSDDIIHDFADLENTGEMVFRIEDIKRINLVRKAPTTGQGWEQYEEAKQEKAEAK
jgi:hypothetical protein|tara:strand:+ start:3797 stop:4183 length:387 start_codon:yes stop_codon:yes gene_type:complete